MLDEIIKKNRSYRRFAPVNIDCSTMGKILALLRYIPSARNAQPLKYIASCNKETNEKIFSTLKWAGYLTDWDGPSPTQRPSAYNEPQNLHTNFLLQRWMVSYMKSLGGNLMRRKHSTEFKSKVAIEAIKGDYTIQEIAQRYEIHPNMVTLLKKQLLENAASAFDKNKAANKEMQRIANKEEELYSQIGKLKVENEFLKKKYKQIYKTEYR